MNNINPIYNINTSCMPVFKQKEVNTNFATNPINSDFSMNGMDALASYNFNLVNKNNDFNDIKIVKMLSIPDDISTIDGEKIYNSNGDLVCVIQDDNKYKTIYQNNASKNIKIIDKNSGKTIKEQECYTSINNQKMVSVYEETNDSVGYQTHYEIINGNPKAISGSKSIEYSDGTIKEFIHEIDTKELRVINRPANNTINWSFDSAIDYDEQGNIKHVAKHSGNKDSDINIHSSNGQAYSVEENNITSIPNNLGEKYKNDKDLVPANLFEIPQNPESIEGEKTYYSNGVVEKNKVGDILYSFNYEGKITNIDVPNTKIKVEEDGTQKIEEFLPNGAIKTTYVSPSGQVDVEYKKNELKKMINSFNGNIWSYCECYNGKGFSVDFSRDGSVRNIYETEFID